MSITEDQLDLLRASMQVLNTRKSLMAEIFYERLFEIAPETRPLFSGDIFVQTEKVMFALGAVLAQIQDIAACRDMTRDLAVRHVGYGVEAGDYAKVGDAVVLTLSEVMAGEWSADLESAWRAAYDRIAAAMVEAAYPGAQNAA